MEIVLIALLIAWLTAGDKKKRQQSTKVIKKIHGMTQAERNKRIKAYKRAHAAMTRAGRDHGTGSDEWAKAVRAQARAWNRLNYLDQRKYHKTK